MKRLRQFFRRQKRRIKTFFNYHQHPVIIIKYMAKYLWLLLLSLGKYLLATHFDITSWLETNWFDLLILIIIFTFALIRWALIYYEIEDDRVIAHTGFFGMSKTVVYLEQITSVSICQGAIYRVLNACTVYIDTNAKSLQSTDIKIDLSMKKAMELYHIISEHTKQGPRFVFRSDKKNLLIFSLLFSSALSGAIILITIIYEVYQIVGSEFNDRILDRVNTQLHNMEGDSSPIAKYFFIAGGLIGFIWLMSFLANLLRHWNFSCTRCRDFLFIHSGIGARRYHILKRKYINFIDYRQSFLMKLFKICSVGISCTGYGKRRKEISALIPITTNDQADSSTSFLVPKISVCPKQVYTGKADMSRFVVAPALSCLIPFAAGFVMQMIFPQWSRAIQVLEFLVAIPLLWLTVVKGAASMATSVGFDDKVCTLAYCKWYTFHKVVCPKEKISKVEIYQNWFSLISKTCGVVIYTTGEKTQKHAVKGLNLKEARQLLEKNGYTFIYKGEEKNA